jgi:hypothetical protein
MRGEHVIVADSLARFKAFIGPFAISFAESQGWLKQYEEEIKRVIQEARQS